MATGPGLKFCDGINSVIPSDLYHLIFVPTGQLPDKLKLSSRQILLLFRFVSVGPAGRSFTVTFTVAVALQFAPLVTVTV